MLPTLTAALAHLHLLPELLAHSDPELASHIPLRPFYALSTTITLFAHDIESYSTIARLFDFLLATPASATTYFFASIVRYRRDELLAIEPEDADMLHFTLSKLPKSLDFEALIADTLLLLKAYPPETLGSPWRRISGQSVLRTVPGAIALQEQSVAQGEKWLAQQAAECLRQERREKMIMDVKKLAWRYRREATFGTAIAVAVFAVWWGRSDSPHLSIWSRNVWRTFGRLLPQLPG